MESASGNGGTVFADLTREEYARGLDWLSHEPVTYEYSLDDANWIILMDPTPEQLNAFRAEVGG